MEVNGEEAFYDNDSYAKSKSMDTSYADNRRESYASNRAASDTSNRRHGSSRSESISEEEGYEQKSTSSLKSSFENRTEAETRKSYNKTKAVGGQTGAATLKERFENPVEQRRGSRVSRTGSVDLEGDGPKRISTSSLRARFEQKAAESSPKRNFVINRGKASEAAKKFNLGPSASSKCMVCNKTVYPMEKIDCEGKVFHKLCFKCETCKRTLGLGNYAALEGKIYCKPHLKQLFQLKGNYDEGFGREQRKADWVNKDGAPLKSSTPSEPLQKQSALKETSSFDEQPCEEESENSYKDTVNGYSNGHVNGHSNGHVNGYDSEEERQDEESTKKETEDSYHEEYNRSEEEENEDQSDDEYDE